MANINDGAIGYASRHIDFYPPTTPGSSGTKSSYAAAVKKFTGVMEEISVIRSQRKTNYHDESMAPSGSYGTDDFTTGSGTVQLPFDPAKVGNATLSIVAGDAFNCKFDQTIGAEQFWITEASLVENQGTYKTQRISFQKLINISDVPATV